MWELLPLCVGGPGTLYKLHPSTVSQWYVPYRFRGSPQWERVRVAEAGGGSGGAAIHVPGPPHAAGQRWRGSIQSPGPGRARRRRRRAGRCYESCRVRGGGGRAPCRVPGPRAGGAPGGIRGCASRGSPVGSSCSRRRRSAPPGTEQRFCASPEPRRAAWALPAAPGTYNQSWNGLG